MNKSLPLFAIVMLVGLSRCVPPQGGPRGQEEKPAHTNALANETSPYLLQHAHNPVNWYPWGQEALQKAKKEDKMIIVSIGYAACHWCHVMEKESFQDSAVANFMNKHFVCIKVDREERPDVDQIYMDACQIINGSGGWPLNCVTLPDGRPFAAKTYLPKDDWMKLLQGMVNYFENRRDDLVNAAEQVTKGVQGIDLVSVNRQDAAFSLEDLRLAYKNWQTNFDTRLGGYRNAPKFPLPNSFEALLHWAVVSGDSTAMTQVRLTLDQMARGGIYDQLGGGFARYSTDKLWKVPHFEKMLYDNAQLVSLYAKAFRATGDSAYEKVVRETLGFVERELSSKDMGFYSSLDADSEGEEGKYYIWTYEQVQQELGEDAELFAQFYNVRQTPNWAEGQANILYQNRDWDFFVRKYQMSREAIAERLASARAKLFEARAARVRPGLDDKILTSWNALMLKGYVEAYRAMGDPHYLEIARKNADFIQINMMVEGNRLLRNYKNRKASINGFLDDYAFTIQAFIGLYEVTFDIRYLNIAKKLTDYTLDHFYDPESGLFFYTSKLDPDLIARKIEIPDNVQPSSNSVMAHNLFRLGHYFYDQAYLEKSEAMLGSIKSNVIEMARGYSNWFDLMLLHVHPFYEVAILGEEYHELRHQLDRHLIPNMILMGGRNEGALELLANKLIEGQTTIYVCQNKSCQMPVTEADKALDQMGWGAL